MILLMIKIMKRIIRILGMMVAATLTLTNCNKVSSIEEPAAKLFTIRANTGADSKTTNDGMHTLWAENDKVSLLYARAGTDVTSEFTNVPMTIASGAGTSSAEFKGEVSLSGSNDFYAIYPHSGALKIPGQRNSGYIFVGNKNGVTQNGYDSMAHLSGSNCPMYGVALDNDDETIPEFSMKQLASVMEIEIENDHDEDIILTKVEVTASEDIVGSYYIDIAGAAPVYTKSGDQYVSSTATVNIANGTAIAKNSKVKVYAPIKPYTQAEGTALSFVLTATIGGDTMISTTSIAASSDASKRTFKAGKIKRISGLLYAFPYSASTVYLSDLVNTASGLESDNTTSDSYTVENARVMAKNGSNVILEDDTDIMLYYGSNSGINVGDVVTVSGNVKNHFYTAEIVSGSLEKTGTFTPDYSSPASFDTDAFKEIYDAHNIVPCDLVTVTGTLSADAKTLTVAGKTTTIAPYGVAASFANKEVDMVGYPVGVSSAGKINFVFVTVEEHGGVTPPPATGNQISDVITAASALDKNREKGTETYSIENAKVMAIYNSNAVVKDDSGIAVYYGSLSGIAAGDVVLLTGKAQNYFWTPEICDGTITKTSTFTPDYSNASTTFNAASFKSTYDANQMLTITLIKVTGTFSSDGKTLTVSGSSVEYAPYGTSEYADKTAEVVGYAIGVSSAGKINLIPVSVTEDGGSTPPATTDQISDLLSAANSLALSATSTESFTVQNAKIMAINGSNAVVQDASGTILYFGTLKDFAVGDVVTMTGNVKNYYYTPEVTGGTLTKTGTFTPDYSSADMSFSTDLYKTKYDQKSLLDIPLVKVKGQLSSDVKTLTVGGMTTTIYPYGVDASFAGKAVEVVGYPIGVNNAGKVNFIPVSVNEDTSVVLPVLPDITFPQAGSYSGTSSYPLEYNITNYDSSWNVNVTCDGTVFTLGAWGWNSTLNKYTLVYTITTNTGSARDGWLKIKLTKGSYVVEKTFNYSQNANPSGPTYTWSRVTNLSQITSGGTYIIGYEATANSGVIVPMRTEGSMTVTAAGFVYSGTTSGKSENSTVDMSTLSNSTPYAVTLVSSTSVSGAYCIKIGDNFLGNTDTKNNCKLFASESATTAFKLTMGENNVVTFKIEANSQYHTLQYNSGSPRFAVYGGTQKNLVIYKRN